MTLGIDLCLTLCYVDPLLADHKAKRAASMRLPRQAQTLLNDLELQLSRACESLERQPILRSAEVEAKVSL